MKSIDLDISRAQKVHFGYADCVVLERRNEKNKKNYIRVKAKG